MKSITVMGLAVCIALCATPAMAKKHHDHAHTGGAKTLAERLGGYKAITAVVDEFVGNVGKDERINKFFAKTDTVHLKKMLSDQICAAGEGYVDAKKTKKCTYTGKDMKTAHSGMNVGDGDFNALVEDLVKALDTFKVPTAEKNELIAKLGSMHDDIVEQKGTTTKQ